jgi:hypothetical protein
MGPVGPDMADCVEMSGEAIFRWTRLLQSSVRNEIRKVQRSCGCSGCCCEFVQIELA